MDDLARYISDIFPQFKSDLIHVIIYYTPMAQYFLKPILDELVV